MTTGSFIAIAAALLAVAALGWVYTLDRRLKVALAHSSELERLAEQGDLTGLAQATERRLSSLEAADEQRRADDAALADRLTKAVRHVGLVRFDAFPNAAGEQSFSMALLDDTGDGLHMTSIYGRGEYRVYAKPIADRNSAYSLTEEESRAIETAYAGRGGAA